MYSFLQPIVSNAFMNIMMLLLLLMLILNNTTVSKKHSLSYICAIVLTIIVIIAEVSTCILDNLGPEFRVLNIISNIIGFTVSTFIPITLAIILNQSIKKIIKYILIPITINFIVVVLSPATGWIFYISPNNEYSRGSFFFIYILTYLFSFMMLILSTYHQARYFQSNAKFFLCTLSLIFVIGTSVQIIFPYIYTTWHCVTLTLVMYYLFVRELEFKYDITTNMLNRKAFEADLEKLSKKNYGAIILFDVNDFKQINDTYGHLKGDECLRIIASIIQYNFRKIGLCYRIGGDEFCVLTKQTDDYLILNNLETMIQDIKVAKEKHVIIPSVSYGYSKHIKADGVDILDTLQIADEKMYECKSLKHKLDIIT